MRDTRELVRRYDSSKTNLMQRLCEIRVLLQRYSSSKQASLRVLEAVGVAHLPPCEEASLELTCVELSFDASNREREREKNCAGEVNTVLLTI